MLAGLGAKPLRKLSIAFSAAAIGWLPRLAGGLPATLEEMLKLQPVRPEEFMTATEKLVAYARLGTVDFTRAVQKALGTGRPVELTGLYPTNALTATNAQIFGKGTLRGLAGTTGAALLTLTNCYAADFRVESAPGVSTLYGVLAQGGDRFTAERLEFSGDFGHCLIASGTKNVQVLANRVLQGGTHTTPIVISGCEGGSVSNNIIEEHTGFGIQFRWSGRFTCTGNSVSQRYFMQNFVAATATQTFTVTPDRTCSRFSVFCNGAFHPVTAAVQNGTAASYQITATGLTPGQPVAVYSFVGLECIQANSGCYDITASGNTIGSSGDSGMLIGADYHNTAAPGQPANWVLDPVAVTEADYPVRIVFTANTIRGPILAAGVAVNNGTDCMAFGNAISNVGYTDLADYKCGVSLGLVIGGVYKDNTVDGTNGHTLGALKFVGGQGLRRPPTIGRNYGVGCKGLEALPMRSTSERSFGYLVEGAREDDTVTRAIDDMLASSWVSGAYTGNNIAVSNSGAQGVVKDNTVLWGHFTALRTVAGQYVDIGLNAGTRQLFRNKLVRISFLGRADNAGDSGYVQLFYQFPGDDPNPPATTLVVNTSEFAEFEMVMALGDVQNLFVRVGGNAGSARISRLRWDMLDLEG